MKPSFQITREIGIDAGHRVTNHHSKCFNLHGHRYTVKATITGELAVAGSTEGMAGGMDFGFLKEEMMAIIDADCDHSLILWEKDPLLPKMLKLGAYVGLINNKSFEIMSSDLTHCGKIYIMDQVPTAENLAYHWGYRLLQRVMDRSNDQARLIILGVGETPNCWAYAYFDERIPK